MTVKELVWYGVLNPGMVLSKAGYTNKVYGRWKTQVNTVMRRLDDREVACVKSYRLYYENNIVLEFFPVGIIHLKYHKPFGMLYSSWDEVYKAVQTVAVLITNSGGGNYYDRYTVYHLKDLLLERDCSTQTKKSFYSYILTK